MSYPNAADFVEILREDQARRLVDRLKWEFPQLCDDVREISEDDETTWRRA